MIHYVTPARIGAKTTCLLRLDLDVHDGDLKDSVRIRDAAQTISYLLRKKCRVVVLSHRGRPDAKKASRNARHRKIFSIRPVARALSRVLRRSVLFEPSLDFAQIQKRVDTMKGGQVLLLENLRFFEGEEKNSVSFARQLASLGDVYINDAFATSHRAHASVDAITRFIPSFGGLVLKKELSAFERLKKAKKPLVLIIGGIKVSDKVAMIQRFLSHASCVLLGGGVSNTFFAAHRIPIGKSLYEKDALGLLDPYKASKKILFPFDVVFDKTNAIVDIGEDTITAYSECIKKAGTIVWNGPMGLIEKKPYDKGTLALAHAVAKSHAFSIVGGGETTSFFIAHKLDKKVSHLSSGGGAMLAYCAGEKLPALEALKRSNVKLKK